MSPTTWDCVMPLDHDSNREIRVVSFETPKCDPSQRKVTVTCQQAQVTFAFVAAWERQQSFSFRRLRQSGHPQMRSRCLNVAWLRALAKALLLNAFLTLHVCADVLPSQNQINNDTTVQLLFNEATSEALPPVLESAVHCVGENFQKQHSWKMRSCQFRNLCFEPLNRNSTMDMCKWMIFPSKFEQDLMEMYYENNDPNIVLSTTWTDKAVSLSPVGKEIDDKIDYSSPWFPTAVTKATRDSLSQQYGSHFYVLPKTHILIPVAVSDDYFSKPYAVLWDYTLAIYQLLEMFGFERKQKIILFCHGAACQDERIRNYLSLVPGTLLVSKQNTHKGKDATLSTLVCSTYAVAGIGMLRASKIAQSSLLLRFRDRIVVEGLGFDLMESTPTPPNHIVIRVVVDKQKEAAYQEHVNSIQKAFSSNQNIDVQILNNFEQFDISEQVRIAAEATIFVVLESEYALVAATFLSRGSGLIVVSETKWNQLADRTFVRSHAMQPSTIKSQEGVVDLVNVIKLQMKTVLRDNALSSSKVVSGQQEDGSATEVK